MPYERETIDKAENLILKKEAKEFGLMMDAYEKGQRKGVEEKTLGKLFEAMDYEYRRLNPKDKFDHEEVWFATGEYTIGSKK